MEQSDRIYFGKKYRWKNVIIVRGCSFNSDLCASVTFIQNKLRVLLLNHQASVKWTPENSLNI